MDVFCFLTSPSPTEFCVIRQGKVPDPPARKTSVFFPFSFFLFFFNWDLPRSGIKPVSPALAGTFFTAEPPGKPKTCTETGLSHHACPCCARAVSTASHGGSACPPQPGSGRCTFCPRAGSGAHPLLCLWLYPRAWSYHPLSSALTSSRKDLQCRQGPWSLASCTDTHTSEVPWGTLSPGASPRPVMPPLDGPWKVRTGGGLSPLNGAPTVQL